MKVILTQPNYIRFGKRTYRSYPYSLGILNACIKPKYDSDIFDPNIDNLDDKSVIRELRKLKPDVVGISTISTEYINSAKHMVALVREALPYCKIISGGTIPTVSIDLAMRDKNVDYWIIGEGEYSLPKLLDRLNIGDPYPTDIDGLAYYKDGEVFINNPKGFIENLDSIPFPDYGSLDILKYANQKIKFGGQVRPRRNPYAFTLTSRGCCYRCTFCSGPRVSGKRVRMRSAENVLEEVDILYKQGIKEIMFMDDHFLFNKQRAIDIMEGLIERNYDLTWKCLNLTAWLLDENLMDLMVKSGCYQITISVESGNEYVLKNIVKKTALKLEDIPELIKMAQEKGLEVITNWVIGFPHETWDQIRDSFEYAEKLNADAYHIHIATPLPNTELRELCIKEGYLPADFDDAEHAGYAKAIISTDEFTPLELQIIRAFEWDRLNFSGEERKKKYAKIEGVTLEELENWRKDTRRNLGIPDSNWGK